MLALCSLLSRALRRLFGRPKPPPRLDRIGPATRYPDRTGAWAPGSPSWNAPTKIHPRDGPLMTLAAQWRSSGRAWQL